MNKEQTPITAEEFYYKWQTQDFEPKKIEMPNFTEEELLNFGEQYAKAKVLEALERLYDATQRTDFWVKYEGLEDWIEKELKQK